MAVVIDAFFDTAKIGRIRNVYSLWRN